MGGIPAKMSQIKRYPRRTTPEDDSFSRTTIVVANQKFQKLLILFEVVLQLIFKPCWKAT
jgi:hypothetical protein